MTSPFYKVNRIMKYYKKWFLGDITSVDHKDQYKKILQVLERLNNDELKIMLLRYVKLAHYPDDKNTLIRPSLDELADAMQMKKTATRNLLTEAIYTFERYYQEAEAFDQGEKDQAKHTKLAEEIEYLKNRISFYQEWISECEKMDLPTQHPHHSYFLRGLEEQQKLLTKYETELKEIYCERGDAVLNNDVVGSIMMRRFSQDSGRRTSKALRGLAFE